MLPDQLALWGRIKNHDLDAVGGANPLSDKLRRENGWRLDYAKRVMEEYKRFCFLAIAAGHPVSPSDQVDQAWHLHLMYTENYWNQFCREVLGKPFHHGPSKGGAAEHAKFEDWYSRTLESYRQFFQEEPPEDIWPTPEIKSKARTQFTRVNKASHWVLQKPRFTLRSGQILLAAVAIIAIGCTGAQSGGPLDMIGPDFLGLYFCLYAACFMGALALRWALRKPGPTDPLPTQGLGVYQVAYLHGGRKLTLKVALADLISQGILQPGPQVGCVTCVGGTRSSEHYGPRTEDWPTTEPHIYLPMK